MRLLAIILLLLFTLAGVTFGALNADLVSYDLVFTSVALPKGAALIAALLLGWILGGLLVWLLSVQPARRRLARARRELGAIRPAQATQPGAESPPA